MLKSIPPTSDPRREHRCGGKKMSSAQCADGLRPTHEKRSGGCGRTVLDRKSAIFRLLPRRLRLEHLAVVRILKPEGIGDAIEEGEQGRNVDGFRNLRIRPARVAQPFNVFIR